MVVIIVVIVNSDPHDEAINEHGEARLPCNHYTKFSTLFGGFHCETIALLFSAMWEIQHTSDEQGVRLKAHTLFIGQVLYFPISHSNEHRLLILVFRYLRLLCPALITCASCFTSYMALSSALVFADDRLFPVNTVLRTRWLPMDHDQFSAWQNGRANLWISKIMSRQRTRDHLSDNIISWWRQCCLIMTKNTFITSFLAVTFWLFVSHHWL